jgi:rhamnose utilization protein RhaD (predicted bifunctional aldolase and dehydrogenase)
LELRQKPGIEPDSIPGFPIYQKNRHDSRFFDIIISNEEVALGMQLEKLIEMSRKYGSDDRYVLAGGGNTSYKQDGIMAVKASGSALSTIDEAGFVRMDVSSLKGLPDKDYPGGDDEREAAAAKDMMAARLAGQEEKRPSVESVLHALFEQAYVLHIHPALVNGMTCGVQGREFADKIFGDGAIWMPKARPGFVLSCECARAITEYKRTHGKAPDTLFLQNHGIFIAADTIEEIDTKMTSIMDALKRCVAREPDMAECKQENVADIAQICGSYVSYSSNKEILSFAQSDEAMEPLMRPFTPDHSVYCKASPLYVKDIDRLDDAYKEYIALRGYKPRIIVVKDKGAFGLGDNKKVSDTAIKLFMDGVRIAVYSESFGGPQAMDEGLIDFILNWEAESYREKQL